MYEKVKNVYEIFTKKPQKWKFSSNFKFVLLNIILWIFLNWISLSKQNSSHTIYLQNICKIFAYFWNNGGKWKYLQICLKRFQWKKTSKYFASYFALKCFLLNFCEIEMLISKFCWCLYFIVFKNQVNPKRVCGLPQYENM